MNRQSDNRNYQIVQGMGFLTKYRKYSAKDKKSQEEVEYNYGRSFHGLGLCFFGLHLLLVPCFSCCSAHAQVCLILLFHIMRGC